MKSFWALGFAVADALFMFVVFVVVVAVVVFVFVLASWLKMLGARASMSAHLLALLRPGAESHFLRRAAMRDFVAVSEDEEKDEEEEEEEEEGWRRVRRWVALVSSDQGSWSARMSDWKCWLRMFRLRLVLLACNSFI